MFVLVLLFISHAATANTSFIRASCESPFPETMTHLQTLIKKHGYTISRIQYVDKGLNARGYKTKAYRVVFFGKKEDVQLVQEQYPILIPFMPLNITIVESEDSTDITSLYPERLIGIFKMEEIADLVNSWSYDISQIFEDFQLCQSS